MTQQKRIVWAVVALIVISGGVTVWAVHKHNEAKHHFYAVKPDVLYRSRQPRLADLGKLDQQNIHTVVNLRPQQEGPEDFVMEQEECRRLGVRMMNLPIESLMPSDQQVEEFLRLVRRNDGATLVHCAQGKMRTGVMAGAFRVVVDGWDIPPVMKEMDSYLGKSVRKPEEEAQVIQLLERLRSQRADWLRRTDPAASQPASMSAR